MSDDQWRAPGREQSAPVPPGPAPASQHPPSAPAPHPAPGAENPYAAPRPGSPYAPPHHGRPSPGRAPGPYGAPGAGRLADDGAFTTSDRHRERVLGSGPGYNSPADRNDSVAVTAMVLGVVGIVVPGICLLAVALGHLGLHRLRSSYEGGRGLATAALVMGYVMTALWLGLLLLILTARSLL